jgi:hypothetical protein
VKLAEEAVQRAQTQRREEKRREDCRAHQGGDHLSIREDGPPGARPTHPRLISLLALFIPSTRLENSSIPSQA